MYIPYPRWFGFEQKMQGSRRACRYGRECRCLQGMQNAFLNGIWMNNILLANGFYPQRLSGYMGCKFFHDQNTIPCAHATQKGHVLASCKFDHTYYRNPTAEENYKINKEIETQFTSSTFTSRPAPVAAAAVSQKADDQQPPFPAPSGKYWEQFKGGWVLKLNSTASK